MKYLYRAVVTAMLGSLLSVSGSPASAVTTVETWARDASTVGDTCDKTYAHVEGDWDLDYYNEISVDVYGPHGMRQVSRNFSDEYTGEVSVPVKLCRWNAEGRYRIKVEVEGFDENYESTGIVSASSNFKFVKEPKRRSTVLRDVSYRSAKAYKYLVIGRLLQVDRGYKGQPVEVWARVDGSWYEIDQQRTRKRGLFGWEFKPNRFAWAYVYQGNRTTRWDSSKNFTTPVRSGRLARGATGGDPSQFVTRVG